MGKRKKRFFSSARTTNDDDDDQAVFFFFYNPRRRSSLFTKQNTHPTIDAASLTAPSAPASTTRVGSHDWSIWMVAPE